MKTKAQDLLKKEVERYIVGFQPRVKEVLEKATLSLLGLEKRYDNDFEIDHCNGRNSVLIDVFKNLALEEAKKIASTYKPTKEDICNFKMAFEKEYKNQMSYIIRDMAKEKAKQDISKEMEKFTLDVNKIIEEQLSK